MKRILIVCLLLIGFESLHAQSTEEIIAKHIETIGGLANWDKINSLVINESMEQNGTTYYITKSIIKNKSLRHDIRIEDRSMIAHDKAYYIIVNGNEGWKYLPDNIHHDILSLTPQEIEDYKSDLDYEDPFIRYEEKGREIHLMNIEFYNETEFYKFLITYKSGKQYYCYMNTKTLMIDRMVLNGSDIEDEKVFKQYEKLPEGIWMAKQILTLAGTIEITSIKINPTITADTFKPSDKNSRFYKH